MSLSAERCAVVIPALNEARSLRTVALDALDHCPNVIVVDDGSSDGTAETLTGLPVTLLRHQASQGKGESLKHGIHEALRRGFDAVISMDGDGQHAGADIPRLLAAAAQQPNALLLCWRQIDRNSQPLLRRCANHVADFWMRWACGMPIRDSQCGQRLYPRALLESVPLPEHGGFVFESAILIEAARHGFPIGSVAIRARYLAGQRPSHFQPLLDTWRITRMVSRKIFSRGRRCSR